MPIITHLSVLEVDNLILQTNEIVKSEDLDDTAKFHKIAELLKLNADEKYLEDDLLKIVQANGKEDSPMRNAIKLGLAQTFNLLHFLVGNRISNLSYCDHTYIDLRALIESSIKYENFTFKELLQQEPYRTLYQPSTFRRIIDESTSPAEKHVKVYSNTSSRASSPEIEVFTTLFSNHIERAGTGYSDASFGTLVSPGSYCNDSESFRSSYFCASNKAPSPYS